MSNETIDMVSKGLWDRARTICITMMQGDVKRSRAERNFSMIQSVVCDGDTFRILALNKMSADILEREYAEDLKKSFLLAGAEPNVTIEFSFDENAKPAIIVPKPNTVVEKTKTGRIQTFISTMPLKEYYTFDEFVEGPSNSYVLAAAKGVAKTPGQTAFHSRGHRSWQDAHHAGDRQRGEAQEPDGSRMLPYRRGVPQRVRQRDDAEQSSDFSRALQEDRRLAHRRYSVHHDEHAQLPGGVLQHFQRPYTDEHLQHGDKQIVITSDVAPKDLPGIEERLISRFEGGMLQEIESPGYETRLAILKKKSEGMVPEVSNSTLKFIASNIKSHVRAMEGALGKVNIFANRDPSMVLTDEVLSYILKDFIEKEKSRKKLTVDEVQNCVCKKYAVSMQQILSPERTQSIVTPRQLAMYISRKFTTRSLPEIAKKFEKSHATIIHGVKNIAKRLDVEPELRTSLDEILSDLGCSMKDMVG